MRIKYSKSIAVAGVLALSAIMVAPSQAADPVVTSVVVPTGTINVISRVLNDNLGVKTANEFIFTVKHWGADVVGSPFMDAGNTGVSFTLVPGSYVVSTPILDGYTGFWFGEGIENGFIQLQAGQTITIARISDDNGSAVVTTTTEPTVEPVTEDGGTLPNTSSPWFNALAAGLLISAAGAFGVRKAISFN